MGNTRSHAGGPGNGHLDTSTHAQFFEYYREQSQSQAAITRFERLAALLLKAMQLKDKDGPFQIADIGGGAGTLAGIFARGGHQVCCIDLSKDLLDIGRRRAAEECLAIEFINCSATDMPLRDSSVDICILPELLEHVAEWNACLDEARRIVRPGGLLFLSTTNKFCPVQDEFELPLYSWYPEFLKRRYEHLAVTSHPEVANYAKYPAVNWFTFYSLRKSLVERDFSESIDRLDMIEILSPTSAKAAVVRIIKRVPLGRVAVQFMTVGVSIIAFKNDAIAGNSNEE